MPNPERTAMSTVTLDAIEAVELADILEYFIERLDVLADQGLATFLFVQCSPYNIDDLRADTARLIDRLHTTQLSP